MVSARDPSCRCGVGRGGEKGGKIGDQRVPADLTCRGTPWRFSQQFARLPTGEPREALFNSASPGTLLVVLGILGRSVLEILFA